MLTGGSGSGTKSSSTYGGAGAPNPYTKGAPSLIAAPKSVANTAPSGSVQSPSYGGPGASNPYSVGAPPSIAASGQTDENYLQGDSQYQLQLAALMKALSDEQADTTAQQAKYNTDYGDAVKQLGWMQDDPSTPDVNEGAWNFQDTNTAAGRAFQNQQNDFAGRGLLQSSAYGTANDNLTRSLNDQLSSTNNAKDSFLADLARQQGTFASDNQNQVQQARIEALARKASGISLT